MNLIFLDVFLFGKMFNSWYSFLVFLLYVISGNEYVIDFFYNENFICTTLGAFLWSLYRHSYIYNHSMKIPDIFFYHERNMFLVTMMSYGKPRKSGGNPPKLDCLTRVNQFLCRYTKIYLRRIYIRIEFF